MQTSCLNDNEIKQSILEREVNYFLSTLKDSQKFVFQKIVNSKEFLNFKKKFEKKEPKLFNDDELMRTAPQECLF